MFRNGKQYPAVQDAAERLGLPRPPLSIGILKVIGYHSPRTGSIVAMRVTTPAGQKKGPTFARYGFEVSHRAVSFDGNNWVEGKDRDLLGRQLRKWETVAKKANQARTEV